MDQKTLQENSANKAKDNNEVGEVGNKRALIWEECEDKESSVWWQECEQYLCNDCDK